MKDIIFSEAKICLAISITAWLIADLNFDPRKIMTIFMVAGLFLYSIAFYLEMKEWKTDHE